MVLCQGERMQQFMTHFRLAYVVCGCVSIIFLAITLYIYLTLPHLRNLHGKIVVSNIVSILMTTVFLLALFNVRAKIHDVQYDVDDDAAGQDDNSSDSSGLAEFVVDVGPVPCRLVGYTTYYLGISMFCWMSVMCFDLGWTFVRAKIPRKVPIMVTSC